MTATFFVFGFQTHLLIWGLTTLFLMSSLLLPGIQLNLQNSMLRIDRILRKLSRRSILLSHNLLLTTDGGCLSKDRRELLFSASEQKIEVE